MKKTRGFTLIELMLVVGIIGILVAFAYPSYLEHITRTRRSDCQALLSNFALAMERFYAINNTYAGAANGGSDTGTPAATTFPSQCPLDGNTKYYNLTISAADSNSYTLLATPIGVQSGDGFLQLTSQGQKGWDKNNDSSLSASEQTWRRD